MRIRLFKKKKKIQVESIFPKGSLVLSLSSNVDGAVLHNWGAVFEAAFCGIGMIALANGPICMGNLALTSERHNFFNESPQGGGK